MITPLAAGCSSVLREMQVKNGRPNPSAALIKALLINGAVNSTGHYSPLEVSTSPNGDFGFGRVNLEGSVILARSKSGFWRW
jgi:serine protease AprX